MTVINSFEAVFNIVSSESPNLNLNLNLNGTPKDKMGTQSQACLQIKMV